MAKAAAASVAAGVNVETVANAAIAPVVGRAVKGAKRGRAATVGTAIARRGKAAAPVAIAASVPNVAARTERGERGDRADRLERGERAGVQSVQIAVTACRASAGPKPPLRRLPTSNAA